MKKGIFLSFMETIAEIVQDKPQFEIPKSLFKVVIFISYFQVGSYILEESQSRSLSNEIIYSAYNIIQLISFNKILVLQDSDIITLIVLFFSQMSLYLCFLYVGILCFYKKMFPLQYEGQKNSFMRINQLLNIYFCLFISIFLNWQIELSAGFMNCNPKSILSKNRYSFDDMEYLQFNCSVNPWQIAVGVLGLATSVGTAIICLFFFRNVEFHEQNMMKRRISNMFMISIITKFAITYIEFSSINQKNLFATKHILLQFYGIISLFDSCWNNPYSDSSIAKYNLIVACFFYSLVSICNIWVYTTFIKDSEIFYFYLVVAVLISGFFSGWHNYTKELYNEANVFEEIEQSKHKFKQFGYDLYLEEWVRLAQISSKNEEAKLKVQRIFRAHLSSCKNVECPCSLLTSKKMDNQIKSSSNQNINNIKSKIMNEEGNEIDLQIVYNIINYLFKWLIEQKSIVERDSEYEHLSLKYITFMIKCLKNLPMANFQLKQLIQQRLQRKGKISLFYQIFSKILTCNMEISIAAMNNSKFIQKRREELNISHIANSDTLCNEFLPAFQKILKQKQLMWAHLQGGYSHMNAFQSDALQLMKIITKVKNHYLKSLDAIQRKRDFNYCLVIKKLSLIFHLFILNDNLRASQLEKEVVDLRKKDSFLEEDIITNENIIKKNIIQIEISLSQNLGYIKSKKDLKTAEFFGYSEQEFQKINKINELMPPFLSNQHDSFLTQFIDNRESKFMKFGFPTFGRSRTGFVFPIKLFPDFQIGIDDDFRSNGTILKIDKSSGYILFDRSGKILGISEKVADLLFIKSKIMTSLPSAEVLIKQLHCFLLFPKIIKKLIQKKNEIIDNCVKQDSEILLTDDSGNIIFDTNIFQNFRSFLKNFGSNSNFISEQNKKISSKSQNYYEKQLSGAQQDSFLLDILSKQSYQQYKQYRKNQVSSECSNSHTRKLTSKHNLANLISVESMNTKKTDQSKSNFLQMKKNIFEIQFKYDLSFFQIQNSYQEIEQNKTLKQNCFFVLRMRDLQFSQKDPQKDQGLKQNNFAENIMKYLNQVSCLPALQNILEEKQISKQKQEDLLLQSNFTKQGINRFTNRQLSISNQSIFEDKKLKIFPKYGTILNSLLLFLKEDKQEPKSLKNSKVTDLKKSIISKQPQSNQNEINESFSDELISSDETSRQSSIEIGNSLLCQTNSMIESKNNWIFKQFQKIQGSSLDSLLKSENIQTEDLINQDPYYLVKRVIQTRTYSSELMMSLEVSIAQILIEQSKQIQNKKDQIQISINQGQILENFVGNKMPNLIDENKKNFKKEQMNLTELTEITFRDSNKQIQVNQQKGYPPKHHKQIQFIEPEKQKIDFFQQKDQCSQFFLPHKSVVSSSCQNQSTLSQDIIQGDCNYLEETSNIQLIVDNSFRLSNMPSQLDCSNENIISTKIQTQQTNLNNLSILNHQQELQNSENEPIGSRRSKDFQSQCQISIQEKQNEQQQDIFFEKALIQQGMYLSNKQAEMQPPIDRSNKINLKNHKFLQDEIEDSNQKILGQLINQRRSIEEKINDKTSVHSSSRSSSSYGGYFLKEIIKNRKVPQAAQTYSFILILFIILFFGLNLTNLFIIRDDMQVNIYFQFYFSSNVQVLRPPRKLLRDYLKSIYGFFVNIQIKTGYFDDANDKFKILSDNYLFSGAQSYNQMIEQNQNTLIKYKLGEQNSGSDKYLKYQYFENFVLYKEEIDSSMLFGIPIYFLLGIQKNSTNEKQSSSFLTLRSNIYMLQNYVMDFSKFLVNNVINSADSLVSKFTLISIAAIISLILISMISFPIGKKINLYEEKILMAVSRISFNQSSIERQKFEVCSQLIQLDTYDWIKYQYNEIFNLKFHQFNSKIASKFHDLSIQNSKKEGNDIFEKKENPKEQIFNSSRNLGGSKIKSEILQTLEKTNLNKSIEDKYKRKNILNQAGKVTKKAPIFQGQSSSYVKSHANKNYILQSKITNQKLSIFLRVRSILSLMIITVCYFLLIIIYINGNKTKLQDPIQINQKSDFMYINYIIYIISSELLAFDGYLKASYWQQYNLNDLNNFYTSMGQNLKDMKDRMNELTNTIYGSNPYPESTTKILQNFLEGNTCQYLIKNQCNSIPIDQIISNMVKIQIFFNEVLTPSVTEEKMLRYYLNSDERIENFFYGFTEAEEILDLFSSQINQSIETVSDSIQNFLEQLISIGGNFIAILNLLVLIYSWKSLYQNIQLMNLFLTFIPDEKLLEEVTLQMLKSLRKM